MFLPGREIGMSNKSTYVNTVVLPESLRVNLRESRAHRSGSPPAQQKAGNRSAGGQQLRHGKKRSSQKK